MKNQTWIAIVGMVSIFSLGGCGGGGGGGTTSVTKAVTKVYAYGIMSTSRIIGVTTTLSIPSGILVNYTSPTGASSGIYPLRKGVVLPSGPVTVSATDVSGTYDVSSKLLTVTILNPSGSLPLKCSTSGNGGKGEEIATLEFSLATAGVTSTLMPLEDASATIGQYFPSNPGVTPLMNSKITFSTTYQ